MNAEEKTELHGILAELMDGREYQTCLFDYDCDCGPWQNCPTEWPHCPLVRLAGMCGYEFTLE